MRFPSEIPPSIAVAPHEHDLKSEAYLLSMVSKHFLQCMACLVCVYFTPAYTMEGITLVCLYLLKICNIADSISCIEKMDISCRTSLRIVCLVNLGVGLSLDMLKHL